MEFGSKILSGIILATAAVLVYFSVELAIRSILAARREPPRTSEPEGLDKGIIAEVHGDEEPLPEHKFWWRVFPGNHPGVWFEVRPEEDVDENWKRFANWIEETWGHTGEPPEEWWDQAYATMERLVDKAVEVRQEAVLAEFRKSLEDL
jgi:hypothetical protein